MRTTSRRAFLRSTVLAPAICAAGRQNHFTPKIRIWDLHCHLNAKGASPPDRMRELLNHADRLGIERLVVFLGMKWELYPSPEQLRQQNDEVLRAIAPFSDRTFGFVYVSPMHVAFSLQEMERCIVDGPMVGIKLWTAMRANAPELRPIVERAASLGAVIYQHTWLKVGGNVSGESTPQDVAELAVQYPSIPIICGHTGGDWERGIRAIRATRNVFAELAGFDPTAGVVEMAVRELGQERIIWGSDAAGRTFASQLGKVVGADIPTPAKELILGANLRRLMTNILRTKGVRL